MGIFGSEMFNKKGKNMSHSTLYGVNNKTEIQEIQTYQNGMLACTPVWDYLEKKYFNDTLSFSSPQCWNLNREQMDSDSEFFTLLSTFDGYTIKRENLSEMIALLEEQQEHFPQFTRLQIFKDALSNTQFDTFYIEATSVADYEVFVEYHWDEEEMVETSAPTLTDKIWDLWEEYNK